MKIIRSLLLIIVILGAIAFFMRDSIIQTIAVEYGSKSLQTPVEIANVKSDIGEKSITMKLIEINNLSGFEAKNILKIEHFIIDFSDDIDDDNLAIDNLAITGIVANLEQNTKGINIKMLADALQSNVESTQNTTKNHKNDDDIINITIKNISISDSKIIANTQIIKEEIDLPNISLQDIQATHKTIGAVLASILLDEVKKAIEKKGVDIVKGKLEETLTRKISEKIGLEGGTLNELKETAKEKTQEITDTIEEKAKDTFKNIFKF
jgi:hypothetical protein